MFEPFASIEVIVKQPVSFSKVFEESLVQIKCLLSSCDDVEDSGEPRIDQLIVVVLRNRVAALSVQGHFFP